MKQREIELIEKTFCRTKLLPDFRVGDTVAIWVKIHEGADKDGTPKYRLQSFEGTCLRFRKGSTNSTFMVRKISAGGIGVDRNFYYHSPMIDHVDIKSRGRVRRSRIYYLKDLKGKAARLTTRYVAPESLKKASAQQM